MSELASETAKQNHNIKNRTQLQQTTQPSTIAQFISLNFSTLAVFFPLATNAALSGEQRMSPHLNHCAVNTKAESNQECQALGIRLKRFVMLVFPALT